MHAHSKPEVFPSKTLSLHLTATCQSSNFCANLTKVSQVVGQADLSEAELGDITHKRKLQSFLLRSTATSITLQGRPGPGTALAHLELVPSWNSNAVDSFGWQMTSLHLEKHSTGVALKTNCVYFYYP